MRARAFPPAPSDEVTLSARRAACPGGVAVGVRVEQDQLRRAEVPGRFVVERWAVAPEAFTRAYQPWHVDVEPDPSARWQGYLHPNLHLTLRNLVGAEMPNALAAAESDFVFVRSLQLAERPVAQTFDLTHLRAVHERLFGDVFPWAGETRTVGIARRGTPDFVSWDRVGEEFAEVAAAVAKRDRFVGVSREQFAEQAAAVYDRVNTIHAFREGNGRSQRVWLGDLARGAGYRLDWRVVQGQVNDRASQLAREGQPEALRAMFARITEPLDPGAAERLRVERSVARLYASRAPMSEIFTGEPGTHATSRPGPSYGLGEAADRARGYER